MRVLVGPHAEGPRHQGHAVQLPAPVLPKKVPRPPVLRAVLNRHERVEHRDDLPAHLLRVGDGHDEDEIVAADVSHEPRARAESAHHLAQNLRETIDHPVAVVITVAVVEFLEVVDIRVTHREQLAVVEPPLDLALDLRGPRQPRGRMHADVTLGALQQHVEAAALPGGLALGALYEWKGGTAALLASGVAGAVLAVVGLAGALAARPASG